MKKRIVSMLLVLVLCLSLLPTAALAEEGTGAVAEYAPSIQLGASDIKGWSADDGYDYIYLGNWNNNPVKWRVLSANGDTAKSYQGGAGNTSTKSNALFMLSEDVLEQTQFGGSGNKKWEGSTAESWCDGFKTGALTAEEQLAVFTTVSKSGANGAKYNNIVFDNKNSSLLRSTGNKVFFLSVIEANDPAYGFSNNDARKATGGAWWLLSRTTKGYGYFGTVSSDGAFQSTAANSSAGARPSLNLDKRQVLFTSAANNSSHKDFPSAPQSYTSHDFKLTIKDSNTFADGAEIIGGRTTWNNAYTNATITIQHKALKDISDNYTNVTATLTDSNSDLLYYGAVNTDAAATSTTVTLPEGLENGTYTLSLYGEDWNDENKSDFATGTPFAVKITIHDGADGPDLTPREQDGLMSIDDLSGYDAQWGYNYLYFGKFGTDPILWRVLSASGNATGDTDSLRQGEDTVFNEDAMFLLSEYLLGQGANGGLQFTANDQETNVRYKDSMAQAWCKTATNPDSSYRAFTAGELSAMLDTTKSDPEYAGTNWRNKVYAAAENILENDKVFFLSAEEAANAAYGFEEEGKLIAYYNNAATEWWLRSAITDSNAKSVGAVTYSSTYGWELCPKLATGYAPARPAFNLSKNDVLFVCTADGVKTGTVGTLTAIESNLSSKWKLTLLDESRNFRVTETEVEKFAGGTLTLHYTGAQTGENEYISAIFYDADGKPAYYGRLKNLTNEVDAEGSVELTVPSGLTEGQYQIVLFNEQYNGECMTDYASSFCTVTLTVDNTAPVLSGFAVSRASDSTASITFSASERGSYYYVVNDSETAPSSIDTTDNGIAMITGGQTLELDGISAGKSYLHIVAKDVAGNFCDVQTIQILGFLPAPTNADWDDAVLGKVSWDAVEHASGYSIQLYKDGTALGSAVTVTETNYTFTIPEPPAEDSDDSTTTTPTLPGNAITEAGTYSFRVTALGDGTDYSNSVAAESARHLSSITVEENENGTVTASARYAVAGTEVTLTSEPNSGYRFHEWNITPEVTVTDNKFVMPEEAVTVSAVFARRSTGGGSSASTTYTVKFDTDGGSEIDSIKVTKNKTLDEPTEPTKDGYKFGGWYTDTELTKAYDFDTKVTADFTLYAKWTKIEVEPDDNNEPTTPDWVNPFTDVAESDWFYGNVEYANKNGLFSGITDTAFAPNDNITRGMFVTVLYRAEGEPEMQNKSIPFSDVKADMYYANAVNWAQQNGIVNGVTETEFAPDDNITREQMAAIMFRYAQHKGKDTTQGGMAIREFSDYEAISDYALNAMTWAVNTKLITGKGENTLAPQDNATRAETAAILQRYIEANK
mgnify:CR=1 FL=1